MLESGQGNLLPPELESAQLVNKPAVTRLVADLGILIVGERDNQVCTIENRGYIYYGTCNFSL